MALINCPECGGTVSDLAPACIHCGRPLEFPKDYQRYALVLLEKGPNPKAKAQILAQQAQISPEEARVRVDQAPTILFRDLDRDAAKNYAAAFSQSSGIKVVLDGDANSISQAVNAPAVTLRSPALTVGSLSFGALVGAIAAGNLISAVILWILAGIL